MKSPCFECETREVGCHVKCPSHNEWKQNRDEELERIHKAKQENFDTVYTYGKQKAIKRKRKQRH